MKWSYVLLLAGLILFVSCQENASGSLSQTDSSSKPDAVQVTLTGRIEYQDRIYGTSGFINGNTPFKPARRVVLDLMDEEGNLLVTTLTDDNGYYEIPEVFTADYSLRIVAETETESGNIISVHNHSGNQYAVSQKITVTENNNRADVQVLLDDRVAGIFNMMDVMLSGYNFVAAYSSDAIAMKNLKLFWQYGNQTGTYTCFSQSGGSCSQGAGIYVLSDPTGDTDDFDDDVLWHEFAHYCEYSLGLNESPGGYHSLSSNTLDLRLAWSEGHASYLQAAIKNWLRENDPQRLSIPGYLETSYYVDNNNQPGYPALVVNYDSLNGSAYRYASNEAAVSRALWLLLQRADIAAIWDSFSVYLTVNNSADNLEAFWDGLLQAQSPSSIQISQWQSALADRSIFYQQDAYEQDNDILSVEPLSCLFSGQTLPWSCINGQQHYLYYDNQEPDQDVIGVQLSGGHRYRIFTHELRNGADTQITLLDSAGNVLIDADSNPIRNDDATDCELEPQGCYPLHDGTHFRSEVFYTPQFNETVYVKVETTDAVYQAPSIYGYIGRYGSYQFSVQIMD
ncbi:hypothetical protein [Gynuella sunshinyii]|uniref:Carboxypeptidase regulatory-like domain-containing protein n=1 Tax=Gynuella sunshinyii YC6258 TaxID=1445510 RepID=A0A0C5W3X5_9GAMM|nr:hypothetical protein [Gynuella sunshinyii]AJQ97319.1 hypothetical Protein YC6258_05289 [Gynuella sunshinyii YC6258]